MSRFLKLLFSLTALALAALACNLPGADSQSAEATEAPEAAAPTATTEVDAAIGNGCPAGTADTLGYINEEYGYCLLYPFGYTLQEEGSGIITIFGPPHDDSLEPLQAILNVAPLGPMEGRTIANFADEEIAGATLGMDPGTFTITRDITFNGYPAIQVDGIPGRTTVRQGYLVGNDQRYLIIVFPTPPGYEEVQGEVELLWGTVTGSIFFISQ